MVFEWLFGAGALGLGGALAYGLWSYSHRDRRNEAITDRATRELYEAPDRYDDARREQLARETH